MSLDKLDAIPVDTHVFSIAKNTYLLLPGEYSKNDQMKKVNMNDKLYKLIGMYRITELVFT